jgi:hypothetical protein
VSEDSVFAAFAGVGVGVIAGILAALLATC